MRFRLDDSSIPHSSSLSRTTAFTCWAGCTEGDFSEDLDAGPVKCNALFGSNPPNPKLFHRRGHMWKSVT
jgi:hypothetical protein